MQIGRSTAVAILAAMVVFAPARAQDSQQEPPPAGPPPTAGPKAGTERGPSATPFSASRFRTPEARRMGWRRGGRGVMGFRGRGGFRGSVRGLGTELARMVNNPDFRQRLGITDAQAARIRQQTTDFQVSQIRSRADVQVNELQLLNLLSASNPDRAVIDQKLNQVSAAELALRKQQADYMLAIRDVLTQGQRQKLQQMRQARARGRRRTSMQTTRPTPSDNR